ncbi:MAG: hypothetical protein U5N86_10500 [Planctomycetota bacterium]|nr:hypothetical protein [Planctomycetota bacterium]
MPVPSGLTKAEKHAVIAVRCSSDKAITSKLSHLGDIRNLIMELDSYDIGEFPGHVLECNYFRLTWSEKEMKRHFDILHDARREIDLVIEDFDALDVIALKGVVSDDVYEYFKNYIQVCKQLCSINATYVTAPIAYSENRASQRTCEFTAKRIETHLLEMEVRENRQLLLEWAEPPDWKVALKHRKAFLAITHFWQKSDVTAASSHRFDDGSSCLVLTESQNTEAFEYPPSVYSWRARHVWEYAAFFEKDWEYSLEYYESFHSGDNVCAFRF